MTVTVFEDCPEALCLGPNQLEGEPAEWAVVRPVFMVIRDIRSRFVLGGIGDIAVGIRGFNTEGCVDEVVVYHQMAQVLSVDGSEPPAMVLIPLFKITERQPRLVRIIEDLVDEHSA